MDSTHDAKKFPAEFLQDVMLAFFKKNDGHPSNLDVAEMKEEFGSMEVFSEDDMEDDSEQSSDGEVVDDATVEG